MMGEFHQMDNSLCNKCESGEEKLLFVVNPISGTKKSAAKMMSMLQKFSDAGVLPTVYITKCKGDARRYVKEHAREYDRIVCCGGDGTFSETVNGLVESGVDKPIGYVPAGTTNDLAKTLGIPLRLDAAAENAVKGKPSGLDVGLINNEKTFSYVASFGLFTKTSYSTPQDMKNALGHLAYLLEGAKELVDIPAYDMAVYTDGAEHHGKYIFGAITNSLSIGGVFKFDRSKVSLNDGEFEVMLIKQPDNIFEFGNIAITLNDGTYRDEHIIFEKLPRVRIVSKESVAWTVDGEYGGSYKDIEIKNLAGRISVILPEKNK